MKRCLRSIFHIYGPNTMTNVNVLKMAAMQLIDVSIKRQQWGWIGHTLRKVESDKRCSGILWMVLVEEREDPARRTVERSKQILV